VEHALSVVSHDNLHRDAVLRNRKFLCKQADHRARHFECRRNLFAEGFFFGFQVIEHPHMNRECPVFLDDLGVQPGKITGFTLVAEKLRRGAFGRAFGHLRRLATAMAQALAKRMPAISAARVSGLDTPVPYTLPAITVPGERQCSARNSMSKRGDTRAP
jgi:hypothetical protein